MEGLYVAHMDALAADVFTLEVLTWRGWVTYYVLFFLHLESRARQWWRSVHGASKWDRNKRYCIKLRPIRGHRFDSAGFARSTAHLRGGWTAVKSYLTKTTDACEQLSWQETKATQAHA
jgi:hypothetical protein